MISQNLSAVQIKLNDYIGSPADVPNNLKDIPEKVNILYSWIKKVNDTVAQLQIVSERNSKNLNLTSPKVSDFILTMSYIVFNDLEDLDNFFSGFHCLRLSGEWS